MNIVRNKLKINIIHEKKIMGEDIVVAVLDSGIANHPDFENRIVLFKDFTKERSFDEIAENKVYDDEGHGTHVAGIIGGNGNLSKGVFKGIAPKSNLVSLKVLDKTGRGIEENVIDGIHWIIDNGKSYGIKIVNISFGTLGNEKDENKRLLKEVELLWDLGYIVVAAAGNNEPGPSSISTPGDCGKIITVGAENDNVQMKVNGKIIYNYSGRGPTKQCIVKPDIVAPANNIISCCNLWRKKYLYVKKSGTSMATPIITGIIALMLSYNNNLTNTECKKILKSSATDMFMDINRQGAGLVNVCEIFKII